MKTQMLTYWVLFGWTQGNKVSLIFDYNSTTTALEIFALDSCLPDPCQGKGFCSNLANGSYECSCFPSYTGPDCLLETESLICAELECNGHGSCVVSSDFKASCHCDYGWSEASNCQVFVGCDGVYCGGHGECIMMDEQNGKVTCECNVGWKGELCTTSLELCTEGHLNQVIEDLWEVDQVAAVACRFVEPWTIFITPGFVICNCLKGVHDNLGYEYLSTYDCLLDWNDDLQTPLSAWSNYCNECSPTDLTEMEDEIMEYSSMCEYFITDREEKPLYERMGLKCSCMTDLGATYEAAAELVTCPFTDHMISSDMVAWINCQAESTCDFPLIYYKITSKLATVNKGAASVCQTALASLLMEYPEDLRYADFGPIECECWSYMHQYCPECFEWLSCNPVTFHYTYLSDEFNRICYDQLSAARQCLWIVTYVASTIKMSGHTIEGSVCWEAFRYAAALGYMDDTLKSMVCDCYSAGNDAGIDFEQLLSKGTPSMRWETCGAMFEDQGFQYSMCNYTFTGERVERESDDSPQFSELESISLTSNNELSSTGITITMLVSLMLVFCVAFGSIIVGKFKAKIHHEIENEEQQITVPIGGDDRCLYNVIDRKITAVELVHPYHKEIS